MKNFYLLIVAFLFTSVATAQYITTSTTLYTESQLVTDVLIDSPCAIVNNVVGTTGTDFGSLNGIGYFENTNPNFPIQNGVILMSGDVAQAPGPNGSPQAGGNWPGDADLFNYIQSLGIDQGLSDYNDASILEFDFIPLTDSISFNFVFASNEYGTFQCSYSDAFAFFLEEQGTGVMTNLAIVPGTNDPISVITIRNNAHNGSCVSMNASFFGQYYGTTGLPNVQAPINFNGHTVLMQAWSYVTPNTLYRMKLVVADRNDNILNSAVFLEGGSFFIGDAGLGDDITIADGTAVCDTEQVVLSVQTDPSSVITWFKDGTAIPGETGISLIVTETGTYSVEIQNPLAPACFITDSVFVEFRITPVIDLGDDILACGQVSATLDATPQNMGQLGGVTYVWYFNGTEIPGETGATLNVNQIGDYTVEVTSDLNCTGTDTLSVIIANYDVDLGPAVSQCDQTSYTITPTVTGIDPNDASYLWNTGETTFSISVNTTGDYTVEVSYLGCTETDTVNVTFRELPMVELGENIIKCSGDVMTLNATPSNSDPQAVTYTWTGPGVSGATTSTVDITEAGLYSVVVDDNGCISSDDINVEFYANANCVITQGISPNEDGLNDCLDLRFLNDKSNIAKLTIYNRYGRIVFEQSNYINEWCGQTNDDDILPTGNYFYAITLENEPTMTGYIYLNRR